jgi:3-deoxy-manno-octulosonate cytidylyltransferase (CMP-KDO synthetase)
MIQRVYEQAKQAKTLNEVVVATDHQGVFDHVLSFGGRVVMTSPNHATGTDRCAEVARLLPAYTAIVNIQGDEPLIHPDQIDGLVLRLRQISAPIATLIKRITDHEQLHHPHTVKALINQDRAVYFSRQAIPYVRDCDKAEWLTKAVFYKHIGLYAFESATLHALAALRPGAWEQAEGLEQLRWLEAGYQIAVGITEIETIGIDTPADADHLRALLAKG